MGLPEGLSVKAIAVCFVAFVVIGGFALALFDGGSQSSGAAGLLPVAGLWNGSQVFSPASPSTVLRGLPNGLAVTTMSSTTTVTMGIPQPPQTSVVIGNLQSSLKGQPSTSFSRTGNGSLIEFFSNVTMEAPAPSTLAQKLVGLAYSVGGYVAYQSTTSSSAYVVIRVPASNYQQTLAQIQLMGNVTTLTSTSNDVTVNYTDLDASLASLVAERDALLKLINQSTSVNSTLAIENQLQQVNAQINSIQSQILQTQRLVSYSTISIAVSKGEESKPLSLTLSATPKSGLSPLGVTFNAIASGGHAPYIILYNFGDGSSQEGQAVIHQFYSPDAYNVTVTVTDSKGNTATGSTLIRVSEPPTKFPGFGNFGVTLAELLIRVVEGMAEIAVIVGPALLIAAIAYPVWKRTRTQKVRPG
jgi:hypothetical protein